MIREPAARYHVRIMPNSTPDIDPLKQQIVDIGRRIWQRGFCAGNEGNHSIRIPGDRVLCTPT